MITHTGAGAYECGEESGADGIARGKRAIRAFASVPAISPYGSPTVINNVETLFGAPEICGAAENGLRAFGSPRTAAHGYFCIRATSTSPASTMPMGFPLRQMIEDVAGGMLNGRKLRP